MAEFATASDVTALWLGSSPPPDESSLEAWLVQAEMLIFAEYPRLRDLLTVDPDQAWRQRVVYVAAQMVLRVARNPDGVRQQAKTAGPFTDSVTFGAETLASGLVLTPAERALLAGHGGRAVGIDMTPAAAPVHPLEGAWVNGPTPPKGGEYGRL